MVLPLLLLLSADMYYAVGIRKGHLDIVAAGGGAAAGAGAGAAAAAGSVRHEQP